MSHFPSLFKIFCDRPHHVEKMIADWQNQMISKNPNVDFVVEETKMHTCNDHLYVMIQYRMEYVDQ